MALLNNIAASRRNFSPLSLAPSLWLSDTGSDPAQWDDISGNGKNVTQAMVVNQPEIVTNGMNSRQVRRFNGTSSRLSNTSAFLLPSAGSHSMFIVARVVPNGLTTYSGIQALIDTNHASSGIVVQTRPDLGANRMSFGSVTNAIFTPNSPQIFSGVLNQGSSCLLAVNGREYRGGAATHINKQGIYVGHWGNNTVPDRHFAQDIAEILVFPTALSPENRRKVEKYLSDKWAITIPTVDEFYIQSLAPALWLDASDPNTLFDAVSGGNLVGADGTVARWEDKSGNGRHVTQSTLANRPLRKTSVLNGRDGVYADGDDVLASSTFSTASWVNGSTIISVLSVGFTNTAAYRSLVRIEPSNPNGIQHEGSGDVSSPSKLESFVQNTADTLFRATPTANTTQGVKLLTSVVSQPLSSITLFNQGLTTGGPTSLSGTIKTGTDTLRVFGEAGAGLGRWLGHAFEILAFPYPLSTTQRQNVEQYLSNKWNFPFYDPDAVAYFNRIAAAGSSITDDNKLAVSNFVTGCKADNIWPAIKACCLLAGADTLSGALVPLVGTAPTNVGGLFTDSDYVRTTGLSGGGSRRLNTNRADNADPQDNCHLATWVTDVGSGTTVGIIASNSSTAVAQRLIFRNQVNCNETNGFSYTITTGLVGISRSSSTSYTLRNNTTNTPINTPSNGTSSSNHAVFARNTAGANTWNGRASFYSIGEAVDLALLNARLATYMSSLT